MMDDKQLDHLIGMLYEAAVDSSRWQEALRICTHYAGGVDGQVLIIDKKEDEVIFEVTAFDQSSGEQYINYYMAIDPRPQALFGNVAEWRCCHHFFDRRFVNRNEFYQDFFIPNGAHYSMVSRLDDNDSQHTLIGIQRAPGQQPFDDTHIMATQGFTSHLQRALRLQKHTQNLQAKAELGAMAIDALALSMLIVDGNGMILHLNAGAERLLNGQASGLVCKAGCLSAAHPTNKNKLAALISEATGYPAMGGAMFLDGLEPRQLFVTPLPAASPFARNWQTPLALVLAPESGKNLSSLQLLGTLYDLSPAELRVASALLAGKSSEDYALEAGVTMNTVRTQLKSLFQKTGTGRQSELVAVLSRAPPL